MYVHSCKITVPIAILKCLPTVNAWIIPGYVSTKYIQYLLYEWCMITTKPYKYKYVHTIKYVCVYVYA